MSDPREVKLCKLGPCDEQYHKLNGYQNNCNDANGTLTCNLNPLEAGNIDQLFCVAEDDAARFVDNCLAELGVKGCYTGVDTALVPVPCPVLVTSSTTDATTSTTISTSSNSSITISTKPATTSGSATEQGNAKSSAAQPAQTSQIQAASKGGLSSGEAAGVAVGSLIAGIVLASLIFFFLFNRYRKRHQQAAGYIEHPPPPFNGGATGNEKTQVSVGHTAVALVDTYLPQPAEDDAISGEMSRLRDKIKNHVQSYYITSTVSPSAINQNNFQDLASATGLSTSKLQEMFLNPHSRMTAIRLYLAWVILSRCETQKVGGPSFLPSEIASFADVLSSNDGRNTGKLVLLTKWKAISGELLQSRYGHQALSNVNLDQAMAAADSVLAPFVNSTLEATSDKRLRNLESIMKKAAQFAFLLFSQPSIFSFEWAVQNGGVIVFPGLQQIVNEDGNVCHPPRIFSETEVVGA